MNSQYYPELTRLLDDIDAFIITHKAEKPGEYKKARLLFAVIESHLKNARRGIETGNHDMVAWSAAMLTAKTTEYFPTKKLIKAFEERISKNHQSDRGKRKRGHEGALKQYIRQVIDDGASNYDAVLVALADHVMVHDVDNRRLTYEQPSGKIKDVSLDGVRKAYREINSS